MKELKFAFEDLKVYQKALDFVDATYDICESFPKEERYKLNPQFIRAASSIALNIAEGTGDTNAQFNRFLQIALNSTKECVVCTTIAFRRKYIDSDIQLEFRKKLVELSKMITGLQHYLKKSKDQGLQTKN